MKVMCFLQLDFLFVLITRLRAKQTAAVHKCYDGIRLIEEELLKIVLAAST